MRVSHPLYEQPGPKPPRRVKRAVSFHMSTPTSPRRRGFPEGCGQEVVPRGDSGWNVNSTYWSFLGGAVIEACAPETAGRKHFMRSHSLQPTGSGHQRPARSRSVADNSSAAHRHSGRATLHSHLRSFSSGIRTLAGLLALALIATAVTSGLIALTPSGPAQAAPGTPGTPALPR